MNDCLVAAGKYYTGAMGGSSWSTKTSSSAATGEVLDCPVHAWCEGGRLLEAVANTCPENTLTTETGAMSFSQCVVGQGWFFDGKNALECVGELKIFCTAYFFACILMTRVRLA